VLALSLSALSLFAGGSMWLAFYPPVPTDLGGVESLDARAERVRIPLAGGDALDGWYLAGHEPGAILLLHGYGRNHQRLWRYGGFLHRAGYSLLLVDFRSSRRADRLPTTLGHYELADGRAALAWLVRRAGSAPVGVFGESLGGTVALLLAAETPAVRAVVADCPFATGERALEDSFERWARLPRWPSAAIARAIAWRVTGVDPAATDAVTASRALEGRPAFVIHAVRDNRLSPEQGRDLWNAAGRGGPLWVIPDAGHNEGWIRERGLYESRVTAFFDRHLLARGPGLPAGEL
jgi:pimeloyl-ACP methyl ester carboxylesterase